MRFIECRTPEQVRAAQRLRYEVYCLEKRWVDPDNCPGGLEIDAYDADAVHFLITDDGGVLLGTTRLLVGTRVELPAIEYLDPRPYGFGPTELVEASRMASHRASRSQSPTIFLAMGQAMYEWAVEHDFEAWMALADVPVFRLMQRVGMPIIAWGEPVDYVGSPCVPMLVDTYRCGEMFASLGFDARVA